MAKTIFIIEDEKSVAQTLIKYLRDKDYHVELAYSGEEALRVLPTVRPDLILLDIVLPAINGVAFLKKVQLEESEFADIPVIILTNLPDGIETFQTMGLKVSGYFVKANSSLSELAEKIKGILGD